MADQGKVVNVGQWPIVVLLFNLTWKLILNILHTILSAWRMLLLRALLVMLVEELLTVVCDFKHGTFPSAFTTRVGPHG